MQKNNVVSQDRAKTTISVISICDSKYASRFLVMAESLRKHTSSVPIYVLALDSTCERMLKLIDFPDVHVVTIDQLNIELEGIVEVLEGGRGRKEFIFSLTPFLIKYLSNCVDSDYLFYVDADIYFNGSPDDIVQDKKAVVGIFGHQFRNGLKHLEVYGIYNVGVIYFRRNLEGLQVLNWWAENCLDSTSLNLELAPNVFGDQKYLDSFPIKFRGVVTHSSYVYCKGPWNTNNMSHFRNTNDFFFFHFSGLEIGKRIAVLGFRAYSWKPSRSTRQFYRAYIGKVRQWDKKLHISANTIGRKAFKEWIKIFKFCDFIYSRF